MLSFRLRILNKTSAVNVNIVERINIKLIPYFSEINPEINGPISHAVFAKVYISPSFLESCFTGELSFIIIPKLVILTVWIMVVTNAIIIKM